MEKRVLKFHGRKRFLSWCKTPAAGSGKARIVTPESEMNRLQI
ncbi:hypothetical protein [Sutcliffiella rhizosphaerae]|nr:hypothetical protein [Sutcliffiella rhizosphaerae]